MRRVALGLFVCALGLGYAGPTEAQQWGTIKGKIVWDGPVPKQAKINQNACPNLAAPLEEDYLVNPKNQGLQNVFVWIRPAGAAKGAAFPANLIHPALAKPAQAGVEIDQPCCRFIPHVLAARDGQIMTIKNSAPIAHNAKWDSADNGSINPVIPPKGQFVLPKPLKAETGTISVSCSIHGWMKAHVRVFDHPYYAVTDENGDFEIKDAPVGKFNIFVQHPANGWLDGREGRTGKPIDIKAGNNNLGIFKMKENK
jgi:hypothetical protein